jgi:nucleoside-diphosphate-sugar epimerase
MIGDGAVTKTTSYIENVVAATIFLIHRMHKGVQTFIFVDDPKLSTAELVSYICSILQKKQPRWRIPLGVAVPLACVADVVAAVIKKDFPITAARIAKFCTPTNYDANAIRKLGFRQPVGIGNALSQTIQWYLKSDKPDFVDGS